MADSASLNRKISGPDHSTPQPGISKDFVRLTDKDMVNIGIPKNYTASPSSFSGTPSVTINHEATQDLDSSNAFEGVSDDHLVSYSTLT